MHIDVAGNAGSRFSGALLRWGQQSACDFAGDQLGCKRHGVKVESPVTDLYDPIHT
jgi:hypothetical protein